MARSRRGSFSGTLDPFGGSSGGLGRYNITGDTIQSLAEYDAYVTATAWANGQATDEEYLASLQGLVDLTNPNTRDRVAAENKLADAKYSIGRNKIASEVNRADTPAARTAALKKLLAYDTDRLSGMDEGNQAYREQQDRVAGTRVDIRQSQYSELVNKVNAGKGTTAQLLAMAKGFRDASRGDPDNDDWTTTVQQLTERVADEDLNDAYQAYQHNRLSGDKLLAKLNARIAGVDQGSPQYKELVRQREDLQEQLRNDARTKRAADMNGKRAEGKVTDSQFTAYLRDEYNNAPAGTNEKIEAGNRLREFTFSVAEDKLRFDVQKGKKPVSALINFYKAARAGMAVNSERYRAITLAIDSLQRGGGTGGGGGGGRGGGGGGGAGGRGVMFYEKQLVGDAALHDIIGSAKAPPDFAGLFKLDISKIADRRWWDNNLRSAVSAFQRGDRTWTYYDKRGNTHELPFSPSMMSQFDQMNLTYSRAGLAGARDMKDAQFWTGKVITATKAIQSRGGQYTMDVYEKTFGDLERQKQAALAGGRWAEYANLTKEQTELARFILGGTLDPDASTNPYLNASAKDRIARDLAHIAPLQNDANQPGFNPDGDQVLAMMQDQRIQLTVDSDGNAIDGTLDPNSGFLTQLDDGRIVVKPWDVNAAGGSVYDPQLDREVPAYLKQTAPAVIRVNGQDIEVHQPTVDDGAALPVYISRTGAASSPTLKQGASNPIADFLGFGAKSIPGAATAVDPYVVNGAFATVPLKTFTTREGNTTVRWVSLDGKTWVRYVPGETAPPRVVIGSDYSFDGKTWTKDGKAVAAGDVLGSAHWWGAGDSSAAGQAWGLGAPGMTYTTRTAHDDGRVDTRPDWMFREKKASGALEYDAGESTSRRRESYFTKEADVDAAVRAARASVSGDSGEFMRTNGPWTTSTTQKPVYGPPTNAMYGPWASGISPVTHRFAGPVLIGDDPASRNVGIKPAPLTTLKPAPTPSLAPVSVKPLAKLAAPSRKPYEGPTGKKGVARAKASTAAADAKAAAAAAARKKAAATAASHKAITGHATGHGALE